MQPITVDQEKCNHDGLCVKACPTRVIELTSQKDLPAPVNDFKEYCLACGHCLAVCPTGAFSLDWLGTGDCPSINKDLVLDSGSREMKQLFEDQVAIRRAALKAGNTSLGFPTITFPCEMADNLDMETERLRGQSPRFSTEDRAALSGLMRGLCSTLR